MNKAVSYLQLVRAPAVFTAVSNILAAHLIATQGHIDWLALSLLTITSASLYLSGMTLNDCYDYAEDFRERPTRPLPAGRISLSSAWRIGWSLLTAGLIFSFLVGPQSFLVASILATLIVFYNSFVKHSRYGFLVMGGCRYFNWMLGFSFLDLEPSMYGLALPIFVYTSSLTLLSREETIATKRLYVAFTGLGVLLTAIVISWTRVGSSLSTWTTNTILLILLIPIAIRLRNTYEDFSPAQIQKSIKFLVLGIIPLDAVITFVNSSIWYSLVIVSLLVPGTMLARSIRVT